MESTLLTKLRLFGYTWEAAASGEEARAKLPATAERLAEPSSGWRLPVVLNRRRDFRTR